MPALRNSAAARGTSVGDRLSSALKSSTRLVSALPLASPLWQPPFFLTQNWVLDASAYLPVERTLRFFGSPNLPHVSQTSPLCAATFLTYGQVVPGTATHEDTDGIDADVVDVIVDPLFPRYEMAASLIEAVNGSSERVAQLCHNASSGVGVDVELPPYWSTRVWGGRDVAVEGWGWLDGEICGFAYELSSRRRWGGREASVEFNTTMVLGFLHQFASLAFGAREEWGERLQNGIGVTVTPPAEPLPAQYFSARPRLIVRDADGMPLAGRYCTIVDASDDDLYDMLSLEVSVERCGPSDASGVIEIEGVRVRGGASRELRLEAIVEGTRATLSPSTAWQADMRVHYLSADQPTFKQLDLITLQGHDSVRLLALIAMPLFALNGRSLRGSQPPHLVWRIAAVGSLGFFLWLTHALFQRLDGPSGTQWGESRRTSLFLISTADLVPIRSAVGEPRPTLTLTLPDRHPDPHSGWTSRGRYRART